MQTTTDLEVSVESTTWALEFKYDYGHQASSEVLPDGRPLGDVVSHTSQFCLNPPVALRATEISAVVLV
jgi:hypothetical protein